MSALERFEQSGARRGYCERRLVIEIAGGGVVASGVAAEACGVVGSGARDRGAGFWGLGLMGGMLFVDGFGRAVRIVA